MKILSKNHSTYPRVGDSPEQQRLRRAYNRYDKKKITAEELAKVIDDTVTEIIAEQLSSGCDIITDGMIRAADPLSHIARRMKGFTISGLLRFFDTNTLYRQPMVTASPQYDKPLATDEFEFVKGKAHEKASVVLFGPYTLLKMSILDGNFEDSLSKLTDIYIRELTDLYNSGAQLVQLDEPALIQNPSDFELVKTAYEKLTGDNNHPSILMALYFGNAAPLVDKLALLSVEGICFDFTYSPGLDDALAGFPKDVGLGIIDGRNTMMENSHEMKLKAEAIIKKAASENVYITSSCGLEYLPRNRAYDKLKLGADIAADLRGGLK